MLTLKLRPPPLILFAAVNGENVGQDREARFELPGPRALYGDLAHQVGIEGQGVLGAHDPGQRIGQRELLGGDGRRDDAVLAPGLADAAPGGGDRAHSRGRLSRRRQSPERAGRLLSAAAREPGHRRAGALHKLPRAL